MEQTTKTVKEIKSITEKQLKLVKDLLNKKDHNIDLTVNIDINSLQASKLIEYLFTLKNKLV